MNSFDTATRPSTATTIYARYALWHAISHRLDMKPARVTPGDLALGASLSLGCAYALLFHAVSMDGYEKAMLIAAVPALAWLGWLWRPLKLLIACTSVSALLGVGLYATDGALSLSDISRAESVFLLKYLLSSQSAILWMSCLFVLGTVSYWIGLAKPAVAWLGTVFTWIGVWIGLTGLLVRWREGHLMGADIGHIPVSNLYEVFVLLALMTAVLYLYCESRYQTRTLGGFVMPLVVSMVVFLFWYSLSREGHQIQPLVPALNSWWMKLHVPANFVGYAAFYLAGMVGFAYLVKLYGDTRSWRPLLPVFIIGAALCAEPLIFQSRQFSAIWMLYFGIGALTVGAILALRRPIARQLPSLDVLETIMYRSISLGFAFFTVATVLGALWAADAWGAYWQWDPKETWALIVWLNYAAWLHMRLVKSLKGRVAAYWAIVGVVVTSFAFLGVNMFLSGLHSYGSL